MENENKTETVETLTYPLPNQIIPIDRLHPTTKIEAVEAWYYVDQVLRNARNLKTRLDECLCAIRDQEKADTLFIDMPDGSKIIVGKGKKDRYETEAIYKALDFTEEQIAVLPKNPSWRKTAILANEKTGVAWSEETVDKIEVKAFDPKFVKK